MSKQTQKLGDEVFEAVHNALEEYAKLQHLNQLEIRGTYIQVLQALTAQYICAMYIATTNLKKDVDKEILQEYYDAARLYGMTYTKKLKEWLDANAERIGVRADDED